MDKPNVVDQLINPLFVQSFERYLPTAYDEGMTLLQKVNKIIVTLNQLGKLSNDVLDQWNQVMEWVMADGLTAAVQTKLDDMVAAGTFDSIINQSVFGELNQRLDETDGVSVVTYGAKGDGVTDDSAAFLSAIQYAVTNKIAKVFVPNAQYRITQLIPIQKGITLEGMFAPKKFDKTLSNNTGSWIIADVPQTQNVFLLNESSGVKNLGIYYPGQNFYLWPYTNDKTPVSNVPVYNPTVFLPTVTHVQDAYDISVENVFFVNSYHAIDFPTNHGRHIIKGNKITPIYKGISIGRCGDVGRIEDNHIFPYWAESYGYDSDSMKVNQYSYSHAIGIEIGGSDGQILDNNSVVCCNEALTFSEYGGQGAQGVLVTNFLQDLGLKGINVSAGTSITIDNVYLSPMETNIRDSIITDPETCYGIKLDTGGYVRVSNVEMLQVNGTGLYVKQSAYKSTFKDINIANCYYKGLVVKHPTSGTYLFRLTFDGIQVDCKNTNVLPFDLHFLTASVLRNLTWTGSEPSTKYILEGNTMTNDVDLNTLENAQKKYVKGIEQWNRLFVKISVAADGTASPTILSGGVNTNVTLVTSDTFSKTVDVAGRTIKAVIGHVNTSSANGVKAVISGDVDAPTWLRITDLTTGNLLGWNDASIASKSFLVEIVVD